MPNEPPSVNPKTQQIWEETDDALRVTSKQTGLKRIEIVGRLIAWIGAQDPDVRLMILGSLPWSEEILTRAKSVDLLAQKKPGKIAAKKLKG